MTAFGQRHYYISYSVNEGLAQSQVRDIFQSKDGHLWIATVGGVSKFDGNTFQTFNKSNGLLNNLANLIYEGSDGKVYAACQGGLVGFDQHSRNAKKFPSPFEEMLVFDAISDQSTEILATNGNGIAYFSNDQLESTIDLGGDDQNFVRCIEGTSELFLAGTKRGLFSIDGNQTVNVITDSLSVNAIVNDGEKYWIATNGDGLYTYDNDGLSLFSDDKSIHGSYIRDICIGKNNEPWFITKNAVYKIRKETKEVIRIPSFDESQTTNLKVIFADRESNIWIGTDGSGVLKYTRDIFEVYTTDDGLTSNTVMAITQGEKQEFYFATYGFGVVEKSQNSLDTINFEDGLENTTVWSLLPRKDELWIGTSNGLYVWDGTNVSPFEKNDNLPYKRISTMFEDDADRLWIGTRNGVSAFENDSLFTPPAFVTNDIAVVKAFVQIDQALWLNSSKGLVEYNLESTNLEIHTTETGLVDNPPNCLVGDSENNLWIGSDEGLVFFNTEQDTGQLIKLSPRVSSNIVNFVSNEEDNRIWIGTDNGLFSLNLDKFYEERVAQIESYNEHDGILSKECNQNATYVDEAGHVWFGTNGGLIRYVGTSLTDTSGKIFSIELSDVQLNFESILETSGDGLASEQNPTELDYTQNRLTFRFSAIHFTNPDKVSYSYRLIGSDEEWSPPTKETFVTYANLPPGGYAFEVRAKLGHGDWVSRRAQYAFVIHPPFWREWWFFLLALLGIGAIGFGIYRVYRSQREKEEEVEKLNDKAKMLGLEQQTLNAHMNRHFIFNALNSIQYYINTQDRKQANMYLSDFAALVRKNLDSAQVDSIYLQDELERLKLYMNLEQMRFKDRFEYKINIEPGMDIEGILVPSMLLQPFVENSIMHGILPSNNKGLIEIDIKSNEETLSISITDNGIGIENSVLSKNGTSHHVSNGMKITKLRLGLLGRISKKRYGVEGPYQLSDEIHGSTGTRVDIVIPTSTKSQTVDLNE